MWFSGTIPRRWKLANRRTEKAPESRGHSISLRNYWAAEGVRFSNQTRMQTPSAGSWRSLPRRERTNHSLAHRHPALLMALGRPATAGGVVRWDARQSEDEKRSCALSSSSRPVPSPSCDARAAIHDVRRPAASWQCGVHGGRLWRDAPRILRAWRVAHQLEQVPRPGAWLSGRVPLHASYRRRHVPSRRTSSASCSFHPYTASSALPARGRSREQRQAQSPRVSRASRGTWTFGPTFPEE